MAALRFTARGRPRRIALGLTLWSILSLAVMSSAGLSGCAAIPRAPVAEPPRLELTSVQRQGEALCLKGRLPADETRVSVGDLAEIAEGEAGRASCEQAHALSVVRAVDDFNAAWAAWAEGRRHGRRR